MYYELYIDVFFLENFMLDSLLLMIVNRITNSGQTWIRILAGAVLGSLLTCLVIAVPFPSVLRLLLFHTVVNSAMLAAGCGIRSLSGFVQSMLVLYASAFILGGIIQIFRPYMRYAGLFYAAAVASGTALLYFWKAVSRIYRRQRQIVRVTLYTDFGEKSVKALFDTGNELRDCYTGEPVNVLDPETASDIWRLTDQEKGFRLVPYRCAGGEAVMKVFRIRRMCIHTGEDRWLDGPLVGIGEVRLSGSREYEMILNPEIFSG